MRIFKKRLTPNPDHQLAFEVDGKKFYFMKDESEFMKFPRWEAISRYKEIYQHRMTPRVYDDFLNALEKCVNKGEIGMIGHLVAEAKVRSRHLTDVRAMYEFGAQYFFEYGEDLSKILTKDQVEERVQLFKKKALREFIYLPPITNLLVLPELLKHFSQDALIVRMKQEKALKAGSDKLTEDLNL